eukprot:NODE_444_length_8544_cov_0.465127.p1 type:complete len:798 gc:universal NODE_444_length_8544_cov_0.465127:3265-5658(+)
MKFGKAYLLRIPTEFEHFALDYDELKAILKTSPVKALDDLQSQINRVDEFITEQLQVYPSICDQDYQKNFKLFICLTRQAISKMLYKIDNEATIKLKQYIRTIKWFRSLSFNSNPLSLHDFWQSNSNDANDRTIYHYMAISNNIIPVNENWYSLDRLTHSPLFYSILYDNFEPFNLFLQNSFAIPNDCWHCLIKHGRIRMLEYILGHSDLSYLDDLLHLCCLYDQPKCIELFLKNNLNPNSICNSYSPLIIAAKENSVECVQVLLNNNANTHLRGPFNWTALEHAAYLGHIEICRLLTECISVSPDVNTPDSDIELEELMLNSSFKPFNPNYPSAINLPSNIVLAKNPKASTIQVIIGTVDHADTSNPISYLNNATLDLALELQIKVKDQVELVALPIQDKHTIDPLSFTSLEPLNEFIEFKVFSDVCIGVGALFISSLIVNKHVVYNAPRMTTQISLIHENKVVGLLTVQIVIIHPFINSTAYDNVAPPVQGKFKIIGHRGNGADKARKGLHVQENSILSMQTAANLGAEYIEFDVQVTKDLVPVIYHDFIVKETGVTIPVNGLTSTEFQNLNKDIKGYDSDDTTSKSEVELQQYTGKRRQKIKTKILDTVIKTPFGTLQDAFKKVPSHVGFNIEIKYPNHDEVLAEGIFCTDLNSFIDAVLECVYKHCKQRPIFFSSFHPEVCTMLTLKQSDFPILFLTDSGFVPFQDMRLNSLQAAVRFAKSLGLLGIVTFNEPLIMAPRLIKEIKSTGLLLFSYGKKNNEVRYSKIQTNQGIDALIVDSVCATRNGLNLIGTM